MGFALTLEKVFKMKSKVKKKRVSYPLVTPGTSPLPSSDSDDSDDRRTSNHYSCDALAHKPHKTHLISGRAICFLVIAILVITYTIVSFMMYYPLSLFFVKWQFNDGQDEQVAIAGAPTKISA